MSRSLAELAQMLKGTFEQIGQALHEVDSEGLYKQGGFKSVNEWVQKEVGYSSAWCTQHLQAYRLQHKIGDSARLKNLSAARVLNELSDDDMQAIVASKAAQIASNEDRDYISSLDIQKASIELLDLPAPVAEFCERFGITNLDKTRVILQWYKSGKDRPESKWGSMQDSGVLVIGDNEHVLNVASCHVSALGRFAQLWSDSVKKERMQGDPRRINLSGSINQMIADLERYRGKTGRIYLILDPDN